MPNLQEHINCRNQLLWLNNEQQNSTNKVLEDFFDCYDLQEVREIIWSWTVEVISSHRSIADDPRKRKDILSFYENMSVLIEAAFLIERNNQQSVQNKQKKKKKKKTNNKR